jgi:hypothetical protein
MADPGVSLYSCVWDLDEWGMDMDLFRETSGITGFWECGLHLLMLDERCDKVARICIIPAIFVAENANKDSP